MYCWLKAVRDPAQRLPLDDLRRRARDANIDLIVLGGKARDAAGEKIPALAQKIDRSLSAAFKTERYGDFLAALGHHKSPMLMHMSTSGQNHVVWRSSPGAGQNVRQA